MTTVVFWFFIWMAAAALLCVRYSAAIGAHRCAQIADYLVVRRNEWRKGLS